jgi:xanthosine utilization system XapX-like protein
MIVRYGRIKPDSMAGRIYFICMLIGSLTIFLVAKAPISPAIAIVTLLCLIAGYTAHRLIFLGRLQKYVETLLLSVTVFLLMVPSVSETLRRVPDGHPIAADQNSPVLKAALGIVASVFILGVVVQFFYLARTAKRQAAARSA